MRHAINYMRGLIAGVLLFTFSPAGAQLDNTYLRDEITVAEKDSNRFGVTINALGYMRNTEYFNNIEQGRTLFGYQFYPSLFYQPHKNIKLQAGIFVRDDFGGLVPFTRILPTFTIKLKKNNFSFLFGTLEGAASHRVIEPMFNIESVITNKVENGFQVKYDSPKQFLDIWINWESFIERGSPYKEIFTAGISNLSSLYESSSGLKIKLPVQFMAHHHGGQITTDTHNLTMQLNAAAGLRISQEFEGSFIREARLDGYYSIYRESSNSGYFPFRNGRGLYGNVLLRTTIADLMLSYWKGNKYLSPNGSYLYSSQSIDKPLYTEKMRELIFIRLIREQRLVDNLYITARFEPVYDLKNKIFDYSYSFYLSYKKDLFFRN